MHGRRRALGFVGLGLSLSVAGCAGDAPKHWKQLEQCLIGEPLEKDENVFNRLRGVQLAESLQSSGGAQDWPGRCADYATQLHASLPDGGKPGMIKRALSEQLGCDGACSFPKTGHVLPAADKLWEAVARAELPAVEATADVKPKAPVSSLTQADWPGLSTAQVLDSQWGTQGELRLLLKSDKGLSWCSVQGKRAKCSQLENLPKFHAQAPINFASNSGEPIIAGGLFSEESGLSRGGFSLTKGQPIPMFGEAGAEVFDGVGFLEKPVEQEGEPSPDTPPPAPEFELQRLEQGRRVAKTTLKLSARVRGPVVVEDWLAYVERDGEQKPIFKAKQLAKGVFGGSSIEYPGEFPGPFRVCNAKPGVAIGSYVPPVRAAGKATGKAKLSVTLLEGKNWHAPVSFEVPKQVTEYSEFRCGAGWGGVSWLEQQDQQLKLTELVCKSSGCKTTQASWSQPDLKHVLGLGYQHEKVLLVYQSTAGDVRTRQANAAALSKTPSKLAFESQDFGGVELGKPQLYSGDQTYLLLQQGGVRLLSFDAQGQASPVQP